MKVDKSDWQDQIPQTNQDALNVVETALEHAAHGWNALRKSDDVPADTDQTGWPPSVPFRHVGTAAYHWAAVIACLRRVHEGLLRQNEPDGFGALDEGYGEAPED